MWSSVAGDFFRWWASELKGLWPTSRSRSSRPARQIVLSPDGDTVQARLEHKGRHELVKGLDAGQGVPLSALASALRALPTTLRRLPVSIRVNASDCHERVVSLPANAREDFDRLLLLELERATPLKSSELLRAHIVEGPQGQGGMVQVRHLLLKLRTIDPLRQALNAAGIHPAAIECWSPDGRGALPANFIGAAPGAVPPARRRFEAAFATIVALLLVGALAIHWGKHEYALGTISDEAAELEGRVDELRRTTEEAHAARAKVLRVGRFVAGRPSTLQVIEEITRLLPDTAFLEEFRLEGDVIEIAGLAASATTLLPLLEKSPVFRETRFTAPLQFDQATDRDRFRLRARLRTMEPEAAGRRAEAPR